MLLNEFFKKTTIAEGGNLSLDNPQDPANPHQAQQIELQVNNRAKMMPVLNKLLGDINAGFAAYAKHPLWDPKLLASKQFLSGSSLHFFNTKGISDQEFERVKPKVGDIDTQVNKEFEHQLQEWLTSIKGKHLGNATFLGFERGNEQYSSLWQLDEPPIKIQIDLEFVGFENNKPTNWAQFSHSSSWDDMKAGVKGVFHKWIIQALTSMSNQDFYLRKMVGRGKAKAEQDVPEHDNMMGFAVSSKEGGGLRPKYEPVLDDQGMPLVKDGLPVLRALPPSGYNQDVGQIFALVFGERLTPQQAHKLQSKFWSFTGILEVMNQVLSPEDKQTVMDAFINKMYGKGAQGLYKNDPERDAEEKDAAMNKFIEVTGLQPPANYNQMKQEYTKGYRMTSESILREADEQPAQPAVKAQLRKGMPHLHDLKAPDFLDLLDEIHDGNGRFKLQNIPLNVKVDGFGGRFGKNAEGKPFMGTSRTEPRYEPGFVKYHQQKGTTDPEILGRAQMFDDLFNEMMKAIKLVDSKLGPDFLVNKQVTCEVLFLPFATETPEGRLKFVGIHYDKLPPNVQLALVPFHAVEADTGEPVEDPKFIDQLLSVGQAGSVMFINNRLTQNEGLDVTEIINVLDNLDELKQIVSDTQGKRDRASLALKKEVEEKLQPIKEKLEQAIINDPNIIGKDMLGKDYEGIVINSRLGPIKVTSQEQRDVISAKQAAKANARTERPRGENKTAVVAIGSFVGHIGHEQLFDYTIKKAQQVGGDPYLFIGNAEGKKDPIPPSVKVQTWHKMYPQYANNISTVTHDGGTLLQKIKHELINPLPGKPPRYDNIIIMVGEDQAGLNMPAALMKAVNKFQGYEHVKVSLEVTPRGTGMSFTKLRNILKDPNATPEQQLQVWEQGFDVKKLGRKWIEHLMNLTRQGMGIAHKSPSGVKTTMPPEDDDYDINYGKNGAAANMNKQPQPMGEGLNHSARVIMIKQIARATGWGISDLSLASDDELRQLYDEHVEHHTGELGNEMGTEDVGRSPMASPSGPAWDQTGGHHKLENFRDDEFRNRERNAGLEHERNNLAVYINGKKWKVFPGKGYADSKEEWQFVQHMKDWAAKKSASTSKKWTVSLTGENPTLENSDNRGSDEANKSSIGVGASYVSQRRMDTAEGSLNESVIRSETIGPYTHELHKTPWGYQVRVYAGGKQIHSDITKPTEEKGQKSFDSNIAYTKKQLRINEQGVAESSKNSNTTAQKIFFARSNKAPKGWSYNHVGFITQDGRQIQMSGHKGNDVYVTNDVTDDPEFPKQNIKIVSLSKPVSIPTTNSVGAENCGTFVANVLQANGIKGIDTQKIYSVFKQPHKQDVSEGGGAQQAAIAIAKRESGKYTKDGKRKK